MLKEFIAQKEWISPPEPSVRIIADMIEFCATNAPRWHAVSISGYHIREAGSTAVQELAFTLADGIGYVQAGVTRGLDGRRFRAAPVVLLQRPQRLLRGDRQVARRAPHVGDDHARALRRQGAASWRAAHARPDRGRSADRAAAAQQRRARRHPGAGRRSSGANAACTPTRWTRRWRCRAKRPCWSRCARNRSSPRRPGSPTSSIRSAAATRSRRSPTGSSARPTPTSSASTDRRHHPRHRARLPAAGDRRRLVPLPAASSIAARR